MHLISVSQATGGAGILCVICSKFHFSNTPFLICPPYHGSRRSGLHHDRSRYLMASVWLGNCSCIYESESLFHHCICHLLESLIVQVSSIYACALHSSHSHPLHLLSAPHDQQDNPFRLSPASPSSYFPLPPYPRRHQSILSMLRSTPRR